MSSHPEHPDRRSSPDHSAAEDAANTHRKIQREQDAHDAAKLKSLHDGPAQAKESNEPIALPAQHLAKPGLESELELKPRFLAPDYEGSNKLRGMVAVVTGGDSGIGRAVSVLFAREGADIVVIYLNEDADAEETQRCIEAEGRRCKLLSGDVTDVGFCERAISETIEHFGKLDILVNNAAFQEHADSLADISEERFDLTLRTNVYGYFHMAKAALPHMKEGASIINTGSVTGLEGRPQLLDYSTTKGAIHAFTKALAHNLIDKGIRVNAVAPGPVWTPLNPADAPAEKVQEFGQKTDMKRAAQPEELSPAYVFLASPVCSGYITGIVLPVTGSIGAI